MELLSQPEAWLGLLTLTFLEIVLGIDNIIFISITTNKLPEEYRGKARVVGLTLALVVRILLLMSISWLVGFSEPLFEIAGHSFSARDFILGAGGLFLIGKSTSEMVHELEDEDLTLKKEKGGTMSLRYAIVQIILIDIVFSFDSILTAVGLTDMIVVMVAAVIIAMFIMLIFSGAISAFMKRHPSLEVLALGFLILIGFMLLIEAFHYVIPKGYIYFAVAFSLIIEMTNIRVRRKRQEQRMKKENAVRQAA